MASPAVPDLIAFSSQLADAVARAAAWTVTVKARPGPGASGIVIAPDLIVTADHVVDPRLEGDIRVRLPEGEEVPATLAGRDETTDLAVLRLDEAGSAPAEAAGEPRVGSLALAVARPREVQASLGLIAGLGGPARTRRGGLLDRFVLVDAVFYPGFSGGPLIDVSGAVIGLNTSGLAIAGPGLAIPWDRAVQTARLIAEQGAVPRGYLGLGGRPVALTGAAREAAGDQDRGLLVVQIVEDGPAAQAGLIPGDVVVRLGDAPVGGPDDLQARLGPGSVGATLPTTILRGGVRLDLSVTIGRRQ